MFRKAVDKMRANSITSKALVGGGSILGLVGVFKSPSKPEQEAVIDIAVATEQGDSETTAYDLSSGSLVSAIFVLGIIDEDVLEREVRT